MTIVDVPRLNELFWNLSLMTPKVGVTEGNALLWFCDTTLTGYACDDFILVEDVVQTDQTGLDISRLVAVDQLKKADAWTRMVTGENVQISFDDDGIILRGEVPEGSPDTFVIETTPFEADPWTNLIHMLDQVVQPGKLPDRYLRWALNPDRLRNIARMKTPGDNPIDFSQCSLNGFGDVATWAFKLGPTVTGVITPMDRDKLRERGCSLWENV